MKFVSFLFSFLLVLSFAVYSSDMTLRLPQLVSDHMVLQRDTEVTIWGWAFPAQTVTVDFAGRVYETRAGNDGKWTVFLRKMNAGGPYTMTISAGDTLTIKDILIGDVWVCSGQSNMELPMRRVSWVYPDIIDQANYSEIRQFYVPRDVNFNEEASDLDGGAWIPTDPETVLDFSATAFFFAKELYDDNKVPIGLINSSFGGSPVEAWISESAIKAFPDYDIKAQKFKDDSVITHIQKEDQERIDSWYHELNKKDLGYAAKEESWRSGSYDDTDWIDVTLPGYWSDYDVGADHGAVWFRKKITLPESANTSSALLVLGAIVDADSVFVNDTFVGTTSYQYPPRRYDIPSGVLKTGENTLAIRVINESGRGGFVPDKAYELQLGGQVIDLTGEWKARRGASMDALAGRTFFSNMPVGLYNAMIHPLTRYQARGVIWYQGETNAGRPHDYEALFMTLITDWRKNWHDDRLPFLFVQLPNFGPPATGSVDQYWPILREAQLNTLKLPNSGMAVTIDIGEWNDIHPLNKKDVGARLAHVAREVAYGSKAQAVTGPLYDSCRKEGNQIILTFSNTESGLIAKGDGSLDEFVIAGKDRKFIPARAEVVDGEVVVWSDDIQDPHAVRYAWSDNPERANLFDGNGYPASPFRTDNW